MGNLNKSHVVGFAGAGFVARRFALIATLLVPGLVRGQQAPVMGTAKNSEPPDAPVVASLFTVPPSSLPMKSVRTVQPAAVAPVLLVAVPAGKDAEAHPFWDRENRVLFAANGAMAGADFFVTRRNLAHSGVEMNPITGMFSHSTPALAANFALETGGVVGVSYLFHRTGHHKLERMTSYVNLSASAFAVSYGLAHH